MMLSLALSLLSTQGVIQPADYALEARPERPAFGARLTKHHVHGIGVGMLLAQNDPQAMPPPPPPGGELAAPMPARSLQELRAEYARVESERPGIVGPIVMLAIGVPCLVVGLALLYTAAVATAYLSFEFLIFAALGVVFGVVGLILAIVGGVKLGRNLRDRSVANQALEDLKRQIDALESAPPPPPPPSSVERLGPVPTPGYSMLSF